MRRFPPLLCQQRLTASLIAWGAGAAALLALPAGGSPPALPVAMAPLAAGTQHYSLTPQRRALLNTIRYAEGTWRDGGEEGYRLLYGGGRFTSLARHPEVTVQRRYRSAAAGAYQFLPATWHAAAEQLNLRDFGPASQDQAALHLVDRRGALARFDREGLSADVLAQLAPEWASLPTMAGNSAYGQPVRSVEELQAFYAQELFRHGGGGVSERPSLA